MKWTVQNGEEEFDAELIQCASAFGISDCWPCYQFPEIKRTLEIMVELFCEGKAQVNVYNNSAYCGTHYGHCSAEWWGYEDKEHDEMMKRVIGAINESDDV